MSGTIMDMISSIMEQMQSNILDFIQLTENNITLLVDIFAEIPLSRQKTVKTIIAMQMELQLNCLTTDGLRLMKTIIM